MPETITGYIRSENNEGYVEHIVTAPIGQTTYIEGIKGTVVVDAYVKNPPKLEAKGDLFLLGKNGEPVRSRRIAVGETVKVVVSGNKDGSNFKDAGKITY